MGQWMLIGLLAFCLASASARAPIVKHPVFRDLATDKSVFAALTRPVLAEASGVCPKGYFRNATVLFPCDQHSGAARM